ncbi:hypothetical protein KIMH_10160 [Bombiscardovia apis]|uniref:RCC1-like domain-containing protein n=1 Tax=Bombiscardovia apis TaxID=2932182 RepID=A0ABM8BDT5_9BIFI|nr:hypothetical protein [Bombiscardovia apis]BDR54905.1 hypothetical protein KIMH_10160 [Bombiscardovia apis]
MRGFRTASAATLALALTILGGGVTLTARSAAANPAQNTTPSQLTRGSNTASETVDGFTLSTAKGPANADATATLTPPVPPSGVHFTQISAGSNHTVALGSDGNAYTWGKNNNGQLGDGTNTDRWTPVKVQQGALPAGAHYASISAGSNHTVALGSDGKAYTWGHNLYGQLGDGSTTDRWTPVKVQQGALPAGIRYSRISSGYNHTAAIGSDGKVYTWGWNTAGQLGDGSNTDRWTPVKVQQGALPAGTYYTSIDAGGWHTVALGSNNKAYAWGWNTAGQLGDGSNTDRWTPVTVQQGALPAGIRYSRISTGYNHTVAVGSDGNAYAWGDNQYGQLGDGSTSNRNLPVAGQQGALPAGTYYTSIDAGGWHTVAAGSDNNTYTWGWNTAGQLGDGTSTQRSLPVKAQQGALPAGARYTSISAGWEHAAALGSDSTAYTWGRNIDGQLGDGTNTQRDTPVQLLWGKYVINSVSFEGVSVSQKSVDANTGVWTMQVPQHNPGAINVTVDYRIDAIDNNGTVINPGSQTGNVTLRYEYKTAYIVHFNLGGASGTEPADQCVYLDDPQPIQYPTPTPSRSHHWLNGWADSAGKLWDFNTPVTANMTLTAKWEAYEFKLKPTGGPTTGGNNVSITAPEPPKGIRYTQISAGGAHAVALGSDGNAYTWGWNAYGQLGDGTTTSSSLPVKVLQGALPAGKHFTSINAADRFTVALDSDGNAYTWGWNAYGQLGDGTTTSRNQPVKVQQGALPAGEHYTSISAADGFTVALGSDGNAYAWGNNDSGRLGIGSIADRTLPVQVQPGALPVGEHFTSISAGYAHTAALASDGNAYTWGNNDSGRLGDGSTTDRWTPVKVQPGALPAGAHYTSISAGYAHTAALASDNNAYGWGNNENGRLGDGSILDRTLPVRVQPGALPAGEHYTSISAGYAHTAALASDNNAYGWGRNDFGRLGDGSDTDRWTPVKVQQGALPAGEHFTSINAGGARTVALGSDSNAYTSGMNSDGWLGDGTYISRNRPVQVGYQKLVVSGVKFDQTEASPAPSWDSGNSTWNTTAPAHTPGKITANIHWTLGSQPQDDYPLSYTYLMDMPQAGEIPGQRLGGVTILGLSLVAGLTAAGHRLSWKQTKEARHSALVG